MRKTLRTLWLLLAVISVSSLNTNAQCLTAFEPNSSIATAKTISVNTTNFAGISAADSDDDYFRINVSNQTINISLTNLTADFDLYLLDQNGNSLASSMLGGSHNESITKRVVTGPVYVRIHGFGGATSNTCYKLNVNNDCGFAYEPNESTAEARPINLNTTTLGAILSNTDKDYYKIYFPGTGLVQLALTNQSYNISLRVYNSSGSLVAQSADPGNDFIDYNVPATGYYYIHVYGSGTTYADCYFLNNSFFPSSGRLASGETPEPVTSKEENLAPVISEAITEVVHPNPASQGQEVFINGTQSQTIKILDMNGRTISSQTASSSQGMPKISLDGITPGIYLVETGSGLMHKLVVKE
jgi:hypothetical protein